jgi:peptide/nickel transport system permease protein
MPVSFGALWRSSAKLRAGVIILLFLCTVAVLNRQIVDVLAHGGEDPLKIGAFAPWEVPSGDHYLGTDRYGRDMLAMIVVGLAASLQVGFVAGILSTFFGVIIGFVAGYKGGMVDSVLRTGTDMFLVVPSLPLLLTLAAYMKNLSLLHVSVLLSLFSWPFAARTLRAQVLSLRSRPYVDLARTTKLNDFEIIFQELVPNLLPYIGLGLGFTSVGAIFALVGLEVVGLGPSNVLDLGLMINWALTWGALSLGAWPIVVVPLIVLAAVFISLTLINIGLEETYNPRLRQVAGA